MNNLKRTTVKAAIGSIGTGIGDARVITFLHKFKTDEDAYDCQKAFAEKYWNMDYGNLSNPTITEDGVLKLTSSITSD